jgi:tRNA-dihydrouridine synthase B
MVNDAVFQLGNFEFDCPIILAPMAGVSDSVFRRICLHHGADYAVSEMIASDPHLLNRAKTRRRLDQRGARGLRVVQIAGAEPALLANAARHCVDQGADVIDINMGCPAKKVCHGQAGSALMRDEHKVAALLTAVVGAVDVPVTLKMRTGWDPGHRNAPLIARMAEAIGVRLLTIHGRTRACGFKGNAEYDTIAQVKQVVAIPVIANGDIRSAVQARRVLAVTGCDGLMIGRAAYGNPWIFAELKAVLRGADVPARPATAAILETMVQHVRGLHELYGDQIGARVARKHVGWYAEYLAGGRALCQAFNRIETARAQTVYLDRQRDHPPGVLAA